MLTDKEKRQMLVDSKSKSRRDNFRLARERGRELISFDNYLYFLDSIQKLFSPFNISRSVTDTRLNKL